MASPSVQSRGESHVNDNVHKEPEKPLVYEPPDLHGRKHVEKITTEYRVREDGCLADRLQNEEFELHFGKNKIDNRILHMDLKTAKSIYLREVEDSGMLTKQELSNLCKDDVFIAEEIERRLNENKDLESQSRTAAEMQDEEFAIYLQQKEKEKLDAERKARLKRRVEHDREAALRLQRQLDAEAEREEAMVRGMSETQLTRTNEQGDHQVNGNPGKRTQASDNKRLQELEQEQRQYEEERDRRVAIKLQRAEAEEYQRLRKEKHFRRAQSEKGHDSSERKHANGNNDVRAHTPPETRRIQQPVDAARRHNRMDQSPGSRPPVEGAGRLERDYSHSPSSRNRPPVEGSGRSHTERTPSSKNRPPVEGAGRLHPDQAHPPSSRNRPKVEGSSRSRTDSLDSPIRQVTNNKKVLQSVDASGRPVHDPANINHRTAVERTPGTYQRDDERHPNDDSENIYLTAVDTIGAIQELNNAQSTPLQHNPDSRHRTDSDTPRNPPYRTESWGIEMPPNDSSERKYLVGQNPSENNNNTSSNDNNIHRNIALDLDPTYSTINHFSSPYKKEGDIRPAPVVQNVKRTTMQEGDKKKKKWFSKK